MRAAGLPPVRHQAVVHAVRWQAAVRRVDPVHGLGQALRLPAVPVRPQWQLQRLEGDVHRQQLEPGDARAEAGAGRDGADADAGQGDGHQGAEQEPRHDQVGRGEDRDGHAAASGWADGDQRAEERGGAGAD